jgi:hypothetical protein
MFSVASITSIVLKMAPIQFYLLSGKQKSRAGAGKVMLILVKKIPW